MAQNGKIYTNMRSLIIKMLALSYRARLFGKEVTFPRAANVVFPLLLLLGYSLITNFHYPTLDLFTLVVLQVNAVVWLVVLLYLKKYPAQWHELTSQQKWFYGNAVKSGKTKAKLTDAQRKEWEFIDVCIDEDKRNFCNVGALLFNPILVVILLFVVL